MRSPVLSTRKIKKNLNESRQKKNSTQLREKLPPPRERWLQDGKMCRWLEEAEGAGRRWRVIRCSLHLLIAAYRLLFKLFSMRLLCVNIIFSIYEPSVWAWEIPHSAVAGFGRQISIGNLGPRNWKSARYKHEAFVIIMSCPPLPPPHWWHPTPPPPCSLFFLKYTEIF